MDLCVFSKGLGEWCVTGYSVFTMKPHAKNFLKSLPLFFASAALASCDVEQTEEGNLPEVEVKGETKMPEYDVDAPDVEIKKKEIEVPTIEVTPADEDTNDQ